MWNKIGMNKGMSLHIKEIKLIHYPNRFVNRISNNKIDVLNIFNII